MTKPNSESQNAGSQGNGPTEKAAEQTSDSKPPPDTSPAGKKTQSMGQASGLAMVGAVLTTIANFGIAYLVNRHSNQFAGMFFVATAVATILGNSSCLGTMTGLVYFLPQTLDGEQQNPRDLIFKALRPVLVVATTVALCIAVLAGPFAELISKDGDTSGLASMLRILAFAIVPFALTVTLLGATRGLGSVTPTVVVNQLLRPGGQLALLGVVLLSDEPDPTVVAVAWTVPVLVGLVVAAGAVTRLGGLVGDGPAQVSNREFWAYTKPRAFSTSLQIALERIDVILVGAFIGTGAAGVYGALSRFISAGNFLMFSVSQAVSPSLRRAISRGNWIEAQGLLRKATGWLVLIAWPYFLILALKPEPFARLLVVNDPKDAAIMSILAFGMMFSAASGPIDLCLLMLGRSDRSLIGIVAAMATDLTLLALLAPRYGIKGAAIAWALSVVVQNTSAAFFVHRESRAQNPQGWSLHGPSRASVVAAGGALFAVVPIALVVGNDFVHVVIAGAVAGPVLVTWIYFFRSHLGLAGVFPSRLR